MSVSRKRLAYKTMECGYEMSDQPVWLHVVGLFFSAMVMLFSYAALLQDGIATAISGFIFGFAFLLLLYGHQIDRFYLHIGNKVRLGADSYDPEREHEHERESIEIEQRNRK